MATEVAMPRGTVASRDSLFSRADEVSLLFVGDFAGGSRKAVAELEDDDNEDGADDDAGGWSFFASAFSGNLATGDSFAGSIFQPAIVAATWCGRVH